MMLHKGKAKAPKGRSEGTHGDHVFPRFGRESGPTSTPRYPQKKDFVASNKANKGPKRPPDPESDGACGGQTAHYWSSINLKQLISLFLQEIIIIRRSYKRWRSCFGIYLLQSPEPDKSILLVSVRRIQKRISYMHGLRPSRHHQVVIETIASGTA